MAESELAIIIASIAVTVAIIGTIISGKLTRDSNRTTKEAFDHSKKINEATILLRLEDRFLDQRFKELQSRITTKSRIMVGADEPLSGKIIYDYLSLIQTLQPFIGQKLISIPLAYNFYGESIISVYEHEEIKEIIQDAQKKNPDSWKSIETLALVFIEYKKIR